MAAAVVERWQREVEGVEAGLKCIVKADVLPNNIVFAVMMNSQKEIAEDQGLDEKEEPSSDEEKAKTVAEKSESREYVEVFLNDIVEFEFEKLKPKLTRHSMHCPNCMSEITKVFLRRKVLSYPPAVPEPELEPEGPVGCLSCLTLFTCSGNEHTAINIVNEADSIVVAQPRPISSLGYRGVLVEILKSIVFGGLAEVITSLSVVASAAASDAATWSIISLALASLIGGVFVIIHNLWDLRDDCYKGSSSLQIEDWYNDSLSQETNNEAANKYKKLLGHVNYFPLHVFFAILSCVVFGMVPPVAYGVSFHKTNDKEYAFMAVATASLLCVSLLKIFKAYINNCTTFEYLKTVVYNITFAILVSGVSYVAGNLLTRLIKEFGFFDMSLSGGTSLLHHATTQSIASF